MYWQNHICTTKKYTHIHVHIFIYIYVHILLRNEHDNNNFDYNFHYVDRISGEKLKLLSKSLTCLYLFISLEKKRNKNKL